MSESVGQESHRLISASDDVSSIFLGTFIHSTTLKKLTVIEKGMVCVNGDGVIACVDHGEGVEQFLANGGVGGLKENTMDWIRSAQSKKRVRMVRKAVQFWFPGFVGKGLGSFFVSVMAAVNFVFRFLWAWSGSALFYGDGE